MDIAHSSLAALQQGGQMAAGQAALKSTLKAEQAVAAILDTAVTAATPADGSRGKNLDITV
ncbi:MAG: hypothetical protein KGQ41_02795 [Alphaproteobacteria bacterium]|nr:hypothetical protein [Alphaproteobacteria bacterium]